MGALVFRMTENLYTIIAMIATRYSFILLNVHNMEDMGSIPD